MRDAAASAEGGDASRSAALDQPRAASRPDRGRDGGAREVPVRNAILAALPREDLAAIMPLLHRVQLRPRQILHHAGTPMEQVYFPESGLVSVSGRAGAQRWVEVWLIGSEGMTGIPVILGTMQEPALRRVVQIEGQALCMTATDLRRAMGASPALRSLLLRYVDVVLLQTAQSNICNATHDLRQRLSRWLLLARDALQQHDIHLTHQLLSRLLGVRRSSVTDCLGLIQESGAIRNARGRIDILDVSRLETLSCGCHKVILHHHEALLGPRPGHVCEPGPGPGHDGAGVGA